MRQVPGSVLDYFESGLPVCIASTGLVDGVGHPFIYEGVSTKVAKRVRGLTKNLAATIDLNGYDGLHVPVPHVLVMVVRPDILPDNRPPWMARTDVDMLRQRLRELAFIRDVLGLGVVVSPKIGTGPGDIGWEGVGSIYGAMDDWFWMTDEY